MHSNQVVVTLRLQQPYAYSPFCFLEQNLAESPVQFQTLDQKDYQVSFE